MGTPKPGAGSIEELCIHVLQTRRARGQCLFLHLSRGEIDEMRAVANEHLARPDATVPAMEAPRLDRNRRERTVAI
eukprot:11202253-Lingulodinium_polyedra.AAC.1